MSGNKLFVDTNIFVTELELLSYSDVSEEEFKRILQFLSECVVLDINPDIKSEVIRLRKKYRLKLPDSLVIATALHLDIPLISSDKAFNKVEESSMLYYEKQ